jgi:hypothetical protein
MGGKGMTGNNPGGSKIDAVNFIFDQMDQHVSQNSGESDLSNLSESPPSPECLLNKECRNLQARKSD